MAKKSGEPKAPRTFKVDETLNVGNDVGTPYQHVDITKACRVGHNVALSFYQFEFQRLVNDLDKRKDGHVATEHFRAITKVVMSLDAFLLLKTEMDTLYSKLVDVGAVTPELSSVDED